MDKKMFRSCLLLIAFALALVVAVIKVDTISQWASMLLGLLSPFFIGFVIAFVLNIPYSAFTRALLPLAKTARSRKWVKPIALLGAYLLCLAIIGAITSFAI